MSQCVNGVIFINYNVEQFAKELVISTRTAYRYIARLRVDFPQGIDSDSDSVTSLSLNDKAVDYCKKHYVKQKKSIPRADAPPQNNYDIELINSLLFQLEEKDKQISLLLKQCENYQILLSQYQGNSTPFLNPYIAETEKPHKKHWWNRSKK